MIGSRRVALATCRRLPAPDEDGPSLITALAGCGLAAELAVWDDPMVDWSAYDLVVIRSTWDYPLRRAEFVAWAQSVPRLMNPADVVRWNTDKRYLAELASAGIPVVPTLFAEPGEAVTLPSEGTYVVKPAVSAGAQDTARYEAPATPPAESHIAALHQAGRTVMVQPYVAGVDAHGETALIYLGGAYSHAIRKAPLLSGSGGEFDGLYREETISARRPDPVETRVAEATLAAVPGGAGRLLYARVDLLPGPDGTPLLLELELTEPSLFLTHASGAAARLAQAIAAAVGVDGESAR